MLDRRWFSWFRAPRAIFEHLATKLDGSHEEAGLIQFCHQLVLFQGEQDGLYVLSVITQDFLFGLAGRADDDVVDVTV